MIFTEAGSDSDGHLREDTVDAQAAWRGHFLDVRRDKVRLPDGTHAHREYIVHPGAVMALPILEDGRLVVVRQYRYPMRRAMLEFPAGKLDLGETPRECAIRELREETGFRAREWARAGHLHNAAAYSDEAIEVWFARGLEKGAAQLDAGEFLDVSTTDQEALEHMAMTGELTDAKTLIGLLWLRHWREGRWPLSWQPAP